MSRHEPIGDHGDRQQPERQPVPVARSRDPLPRLNESDIKALKVVGAFRMVNARDVAEMNMNRLIKRGLVQRTTIYTPRGGERHEILSLTPQGSSALSSLRGTSDTQRYWAGMVKPSEIEHDLAIYPTYQKEAEKDPKVRRKHPPHSSRL